MLAFRNHELAVPGGPVTDLETKQRPQHPHTADQFVAQRATRKGNAQDQGDFQAAGKLHRTQQEHERDDQALVEMYQGKTASLAYGSQRRGRFSQRRANARIASSAVHRYSAWAFRETAPYGSIGWSDDAGPPARKVMVHDENLG